MISVPRLSQVLQTLTGGRQSPSDGQHQHEPTITNHNMVRSLRGRLNLSGPTSVNDDETPPPQPQGEEASSRAKRNRVASLSDHGQKRRRLSGSSALPQVHIPLRARAVPGGRNGPAPKITPISSHPPPLVTQDSSISNSPLNSPAYKPQYDQFKRIEEKAQKVVKKNIHNDASKDDKRKLRSEHGSTRSKTELAQYFSAFDDMLSLAPADPSEPCFHAIYASTH